jgi:hypothetical protein
MVELRGWRGKKLFLLSGLGDSALRRQLHLGHELASRGDFCRRLAHRSRHGPVGNFNRAARKRERFSLWERGGNAP